MLLLDSGAREIDGVTLFPDHADPLQWYYMPQAPHLTTRRDAAAGNAEVPQFSLIRFRGQAGTGGFLNFDVNLGLPPAKLEELRGELQREMRLRDAPRLAPVPVHAGTVKLLMLGHDSSATPPADGSAAPAPAGPAFVLTMDHHASPALYGDNQAAFSVRLDAAGVTVVEKALAGEILPIAVVYSLDYLGLRPAYGIRLKIDWRRVQEHMDESFNASFIVSSVEIGQAVDELVEEKAIVFEADSFFLEDDSNTSLTERRDAALAQVRSMITEAFFTASLPPFEIGKEDDWDKAVRVASAVAMGIATGGASAAASMASFNYKRMDYTRVDDKVLNVDFSERTTVQRSMHPQGHLAGLFRLVRDSALPHARFVIDADLDDPWFERRRLAIAARADFARDGIGAINVRARYGQHQRNVLLTAQKPEAELDWASLVVAGAMDRRVELSYEVDFAAANGAQRPRRISSPTEVIELEALEVNPRDLYTVVPVPIVALGLSFEQYPQVEVQLRYEDPGSGIAQDELFRLDASRQSAEFARFVLDPDVREYQVRVVYRAADHRDVDTGWVRSSAPQVTVRDPFPRKHRVSVVPNVDWAQVARVFVDLRYDDDANGVHEEAALEFAEGDGPQAFVVPLEDPQRRLVHYRAIFQFRDGRLLTLPSSSTVEPRIFLDPSMRGRRVVEVLPPADFTRARLRRVTVDLRFEDMRAGLSFNDQLVFEGPQARGRFEYDLADEARDRYESRVTYLFQNGMERAGDWEAGDASLLQIRAP